MRIAGSRRTALQRIDSAPEVLVSTISGFEIVLKSARGKLRLSKPSGEWLKEVLEHHGLTLVPLEAEAAILAAELPPIHDDPCDCFIIAMAKLRGAEVVTTDERFAAYGIEVIG